MKTPLATFITDTHLGEDNIDAVKSVFSQAIKKAISFGHKVIYHLGDIFKSRKGQSQEILSVFDDILDEIHQAGLKLILIPGNHDKQDYGSWKSFLKSYRHHPAIELVNKMSGYLLSDTVNLSLIPFFEEHIFIEFLGELVKNGIDANKKNVLGIHQGIQGAVMNNGTAVESAISNDLLTAFDLVLVGHYHDQQELFEGRVRYIGAGLQHNFGESPNKGVTVLYDDLSTELIILDFPKYTTFEVNANDINLQDIADIKEEKKNSGDFIRIILTGKEADVKSFNKQDLLAAGIKVEMREDKIEKKVLESRIEPFDASSLKHEFEEFCNKNKLSLEEGAKYFNKVIAA